MYENEVKHSPNNWKIQPYIATQIIYKDQARLWTIPSFY